MPSPQRDLVHSGHRLEIGIVVALDGRYFDGNTLPGFKIAAGQSDGRIAAVQLSVARHHHAAAKAVRAIDLNLVESVLHALVRDQQPQPRLEADTLLARKRDA